MRQSRFGILALALGLCATTALYGQRQPTEGIRFGLGGGIIIPTGDYATFDETGWHVLGVVQLPIAQSPIHLRFDAMYGATMHKIGSGNTKLFGATADLLYHLGSRAASMRPYVLGGVGFYNVANGASSTNFAFGLGGGVLFSIGDMHAFLEGRYMSVQTSGSSLSFVPITLGLMFR